MIKTIIGLILLLSPFLLIYRFKDKKIGFAYILSFIIVFQLIIAVITQLFGIFNYWTVLIVNFIIFLVVIWKINFIILVNSFKRLKIDWILIFVILVILISLVSIHYDYTGEVTSVLKPYNYVENMKYVYPYFSDEWSAVSFIKYSISFGKLPLKNPLWYNTPFSNLELPFHSFSSEIFFILNLDPLIQYNLLSIFSGLIICILIYFILRINNIPKLISAITSLSALYIVNGANLPGLWTFIPIILGMILMLMGFLFMSIKNTKMALFLCFLTLIFYPPLFVFYAASFLVYILFTELPKTEKVKSLKYFVFISILSGIMLFLLVYFTKDSFIDSLVYISSKLFYKTFTQYAIPDFSIWKIVPVLSLFFAFIGLKNINKKYWLIFPISIGGIYWIVYSRVFWRFIIEYERVVFSCSVLIIILSGFGIYYFVEYFKSFDILQKYKILEILQILILIGFLISAFNYSERNNWKELKLHSLDGGIYNPASPANVYLHKDDLKLFNFEKNNFLSPPWKGTVIGVSTNNYPLLSKPSVITNLIGNYFEFMTVDCNEKTKIAREKNIDYIYSSEFECDGFELEGVSFEGFYLYKVLD